MGNDPKTSVLNKWNQVWDAQNVFVTDGAFMVSSACQNPSLTYMAMTARAANYAVEELKKAWQEISPQEKLPWVRRYVPYNEFFVFGVIREPVDYLLSLYNAHSRENLRGSAMPTRGMDFDTFLNVWCKDNPQAEPQHRRFADRHRRFQVSHLIDYDSLSKEFAAICARLDLGEVRLKHLNLSPENLTRHNLTDAQIARIERRYAQDYELIKNRPRVV